MSKESTWDTWARPPCFVVAGVQSGVGKTSVAVGLMVALRRRGLRVQPFKVGPDFLDPMHHAAACGVPSVNLDGWMLGRHGCQESFEAACKRSCADVAVVEGVMGLHDGLDGRSDAGSTAELAKWLHAPVLLVIDAWCLSRSAAAMVLGYTIFDPEVAVKGVVFNRVAGDSHAEWLREAMRSTTAVSHLSVLGCLPKDANVHIAERHLGLCMPEQGDAHLEALGALVANNMDIDALLCMASVAKEGLPETSLRHPENSLQPSRQYPLVRIGIAKDEAFCFYYEDNLQLLEAAGAELVQFSPLTDPKLPEDLQALYFGGGYPELHGERLEGNASFRESVRDFCKSGGLCWAECGGLMYLAQTMTVRSKDIPCAAQRPPRQRFQMAGVLPFDVSMTQRMVMGYCTSRPGHALAELLQISRQVEFRCQQYHFSEVTLNGEPAELVDSDGRSMGLRGVPLCAYEARMERPGFSEFVPEGILQNSTVASYCHVHFKAAPGLAEALVAAARRRLTVVSLLPSGTEALCSIPNASERLVAVSAHCDFPPDVLQLRKATRSLIQVDGRSSADVEEQVQRLLAASARGDKGWEHVGVQAAGVTDFHPIDVDWLRSARPGVVLSQEACLTCDAGTSALGRALSAAGLEAQRSISVGAATVDEILATIDTIGHTIGEKTAASSVRQDLQRRLDHVAQVVHGLGLPRVLGLESVCPLVASGQWLPDMRQRAGGLDALGDRPGAKPRRLSWDDVASSNADVIIVFCCGRSAVEAAEEVVKHLVSKPGFWQLPAMQHNPARFYVVGHALFSRPGPRIVEGIEQLASLIHPGSLPAPYARDALQLHRSHDGDAVDWLAVGDLGDLGVLGDLGDLAPSAHEAPGAGTATWRGVDGNQDRPTSGAHTATGMLDEIVLLQLSGPRYSDAWRGKLLKLASGVRVAWQQQVCSKVSGETGPTPRAGHAAARWGHILFVFGGHTRSGQVLAKLELLHLETFCWTHGSTTGPEPAPRKDASLVIDEKGSRAVLFGGSDGEAFFADVHVLDLVTWCWEQVQCRPGPCPRAHHAACAWGAEGMLVHGGCGVCGELGDLWLLSWRKAIQCWVWEKLCDENPVVSPRLGHAAAAVGDALLITGGHAGDSTLADSGIFLLRTREWLVLPEIGQPVCGHGLVVLDSGVLVWSNLEGTGGTDDLDRRVCGWLLPYRELWASVMGTVGSSATASSPSVGLGDTGIPAWDDEKPLSLEDVRRISDAGDARATQALAALERLSTEKRSQATWSMLHRMATCQGRYQYEDPASGYAVFTSTYLRKRPCCGFGCRHCPYGHANVPKVEKAKVAADW